VKVKLSVGNYVDDVLCDVVPMEACHVLLRRPWQFDKKTIHDGLTKKITFTHKHQKFVLHPLTPNQVLEDEVQMKQKSIKRGNKVHENNYVPRVMYLCPTSNQTYIHLGRQFLLSYFLFQVSVNMTLRIDQSCAKLLTMDKQNFDFKQLHKEEKWKYKKEHKNVFRIEPDCPVINTTYGNLGKTLLFFYAVNISLILLCDCCYRKVFDPGGS